MPDSNMNAEPAGGLFTRWRRILFSPSTRHSVFTLIIAGVLIGVIAVYAFEYSLKMTATDEFCSSCHANNATKEWHDSVHHTNAAGFVVGCADCHLPREFVPKMLRKTKGATKEVWEHITGLIDTPEKYEAHRLEMAEVEWNRLRANGAEECRNCHQPDFMADKNQAGVASMHKNALSGGQICIDCHKGIAHRPPNRP